MHNSAFHRTKPIHHYTCLRLISDPDVLTKFGSSPYICSLHPHNPKYKHPLRLHPWAQSSGTMNIRSQSSSLCEGIFSKSSHPRLTKYPSLQWISAENNKTLVLLSLNNNPNASKLEPPEIQLNVLVYGQNDHEITRDFFHFRVSAWKPPEERRLKLIMHTPDHQAPLLLYWAL